MKVYEIPTTVHQKQKRLNRSNGRWKQNLVGLILSWAVLLPAPLVLAQAANEVQTLEEIVVFAQKRDENLQDVALSVQVVSSDDMAQKNLTNIVALSEQFPAVHVATSGRSSVYFIRGTGSGESQSFDQSVGTFVDNIYHGRSRNSSATFLDLDHVEVLKGPQSTYFGNSAIAGAFNILTRKPSHETEGWVRALVGPGGKNGSPYAVEGAVNLPLSDEFAVRVAGTFNGQEGYLKNVHTGDKAPNDDNYAVRATALYTPSDRLDMTLKLERSRSLTEGGFIVRQEDCPPPAPYTAGGFCGINLAAEAPVSLDTLDYVASDGNELEFDTQEAVFTLNYDMDQHTFTSTTGFSTYEYELAFDSDGTSLDLLNIDAPEEYDQFSQEFRIASASDGDLQYMAGVYYQKYDLDIQQSVNFFFLTAPFSGIPPLAPFLPLGQQVNAEQTEETFSIFGSVSMQLSELWQLTLGLRATRVEKEFDWALIYGTATQQYSGIERLPAGAEAVAGSLGLGAVGVVSLDGDDDALLPSVNLQYQFSEDVMGYVSYSRGFKSGGFSVADTSADPANYPFDSEFVDAYELGIKGDYLDNRLSMSAALFWNDFTDLQVTIQGTNPSGGLINIVRNAGESRSKGAEFELRWLVTPDLDISAHLTYLDSGYEDYQNAAPTYAQQFAGASIQDLSGRPTIYSPEWSGNVSAAYSFDIGSNMSLTAEVTGIFSSDYYTYSTIDEQSVQDDFVRFDARITLDLLDSGWSFDLIGKNITDETVLNFTGYQPTSFGSLFQGQEPPRQFMVQARYEF